MAQVELAISIFMDEADAERLRSAFARRMGNPDTQLSIVLATLKQLAIQQIASVVVSEERQILEDQKALVVPPTMG